jgi:hypothetical protein
MKLQYTFTSQFFLRGINMAKSKRPLNQEDNKAPQPTGSTQLKEISGKSGGDSSNQGRVSSQTGKCGF